MHYTFGVAIETYDDSDARRLICEIGRRLYARGFAGGNDGNLSVRRPDGTVLCTPTLISKGFMTPDDLCVVDLDGVQQSGARRRTSEILLHCEIYRNLPEAQAVVHCHPPHATAFAVARVDVPTGILPEIEVFLGRVPRAEYETPGTMAFAATIRPHLHGTNTVVLSNHGTVSWGTTLEQAFWNTEILDNYCRILLLALPLGGLQRLPPEKVRELLALRPAFGLPVDPRVADGSAELYANPTLGGSSEAS